MWKRKELKDNAKKVVKKNYWTAIVVCFLIALFTGEFGTSILGLLNSNENLDPYYIEHEEMIKNKRKIRRFSPKLREREHVISYFTILQWRR